MFSVSLESNKAFDQKSNLSSEWCRAKNVKPKQVREELVYLSDKSKDNIFVGIIKSKK